VFVIPAGAPGARPGSKLAGVLVPEPEPLDPVSKLLRLREPRVEPLMLNRPFLLKLNLPSALLRAEFMVPTEDSVTAEMEAARVLVLRYELLRPRLPKKPPEELALARAAFWRSMASAQLV
jgi:hypothetical protein